MARKSRKQEDAAKEHYGAVFVFSTAASLISLLALFVLGTNGRGLQWQSVTAFEALKTAGAGLVGLLVCMLVFVSIGFWIDGKIGEHARRRRRRETVANEPARPTSARGPGSRKEPRQTPAVHDPIAVALNAAALIGRSQRAGGTVPDAVLEHVAQSRKELLLPLLGRDAVLALVKSGADCQAEAERRLARCGKTLTAIGGPRTESDEVSDAADAGRFAGWIASNSDRLNTPLSDGGTFLHLATRAANPDLVGLLLSAGARPDAAEPEKKYSALHVALESLRSTRGQKEVVRLLVEAGSDLEATLSGAMYSPIGLVRTLGLDEELRELVLPAKDRAEREEARRLAEEAAKADHGALERAVEGIPPIDTLDPDAAERAVVALGRSLYRSERVDVGYGLESYSVLREDLFIAALKRIGFHRGSDGGYRSARFRVRLHFLTGHQSTYVDTFAFEACDPSASAN